MANRPNYPDLIALEKITGSYTISSVDPGGTKDATIQLDSKYFIVGMPKVSTSTTGCSVILINGGKNEFTVRASNGTSTATDVVVDYEAYAIK